MGATSSKDGVNTLQEKQKQKLDDFSASKAANDNGTGGGGNAGDSNCPMRRNDGSYSFDWGALFRKEFPHGPGGKKPISEDAARAKTAASSSDGGGCPVRHSSPSPSPSSDRASDGCPVKTKSKHPEYNVYSQPIDPSNNMPQVANQMPTPFQSKPLPTDRVESNIPKVWGRTSETHPSMKFTA